MSVEFVDQPSSEEVRRVDRWRCSTEGHSPSMVREVGKPWPVALICTRCGESTPVGEPVPIEGPGMRRI